MATAVVLMTHRFDNSIIEEFHRIRQGSTKGIEYFILSDNPAEAPAAVAPWIRAFDFDEISSRASRVIGTDILRNMHLAWITFFETHPGFKEYWFIEYDVKFSGPWNDLFTAFRDTPHDLLCTHLYPWHSEPEWFWWSEIQGPGGAPPPRENLLRGFLPIARLSRAGISRLRDAVDEGWSGFFEGLIPTLFRCSGLSIADMGGEGLLVPDGFNNRFYTSVSDSMGSLLNLGTMRFRPPIPFPGILRNRLYHPVKPESATLDATSDETLRIQALEQALVWLAKEKGRDTERLLQIATGLNSGELLAFLERTNLTGSDTLRLQLLSLIEPPSLSALVRGLLQRLTASGRNL
jgi:hypothetical protein